MKHAHVDDTLTRAEREAPFRLSDPGPALDEGPTRLACLWEGETFEDVDILSLIAAKRREPTAIARTEVDDRGLRASAEARPAREAKQ